MIRLNVKVKYDLEYDMQRNLKAWEQRFTSKLKVKSDFEYDVQRNLPAQYTHDQYNIARLSWNKDKGGDQERRTNMLKLSPQPRSHCET